MTAVEMSYDGINLSDLIIIKEIRRDIGNPREIQTNNSIFLGESFERVSTRGKTIHIEFAIWSKRKNEIKRKLAGLFYTDKPKRLVFSDESDKYYLALLTGEVQVIETQGLYSEGSMSFFVPDGVAHSYAYKEVTTHREESDRIVFTVENEGTVDAYPIIEVEHEETNGYLAFVNKNGISALGNEEALDASLRPSEPLLDFKGGKLFDSVSLPMTVYSGGSSSSGNSKTEFISNDDRGYRLRIKLETVSQNAGGRSSQVRVQAHLLNRGWTFMLYDINASVTVNGQTFTYYGRPQMLQNNSSLLLMDKTITVIHDSNGGKTITASGWLTGQGGYSPNRLTVRSSRYSLPRLTISSSYKGFTHATGPNLAQKNVAVLNDDTSLQKGTLKIESAWGRNHLALHHAPPELGQNHLRAASGLTWVLPGSERSTNDYLWWRQIFWCGRADQRGWLKVVVSDEDNKFLYGVETIKRGDDLNTEYNFFVTDGKGGFEFKKRWTFKPTHKNEENPFNSGRGWSDIVRKDDQVDVYWFGSRERVHCPSIKGKKSAKVHVVWGAHPGHEWPTHMYLDELYFRMDFGADFNEKYKNAFGKQSSVVINSEDDTIQLDGIYQANLLVQGAGFISLPPGESELQFFPSKWVQKMPRVTIRFRERWL